ncbi:MAG: hypothetical protein U1E65_08035 [Myxococcota bacterium]
MSDEKDTEAMSQAVGLPPAVGGALRHDLDREVSSRDFSSFHAAVMARIQAEEASALAAPVLEALRVVPEPPGDLAKVVAERLAAEAVVELDPRVVALLRADVQAAVEAQDFDGFSEEVLGRVFEDLEDELAVAPLALALVRNETERVVAEQDFGRFAEALRPEEAEFRDQVVRELRSVDGRFDREFKRGVDKKLVPEIERRARPSFISRWGRQMAGFAVAAAAIIAIWSQPPLENPEDTLDPSDIEAVTVDSVKFDGNMTVTQDKDMAVIWLSDADEDDDEEDEEPEVQP